MGAPAAPELAPFREALKARGFDPASFGDADDEAILDYLTGMARSAQDPQVQQLVNLGRQVAGQWDAWKKFQQGQAAQPVQAPAQAPPAPAEKPWWPKPPQWDPALERFLTATPAGDIIVRPEYIGQVAPDLPQKYMAYQAWRRDRQQALYSDPVEAIMPGLQPRLDDRYATKELIEQKIQDLINQQFISAWSASNEQTFFERDPRTGQVLRNPMTGQPVLNEYGSRYHQAMEMLRGFDASNPAHVVQLAQMIVGAPPAANGTGRQAPPLPQPAPPAPPPTPQQSFVQSAQQFSTPPVAQRGGAWGQPALSPNPQDLAPPLFSEILSQVTGAAR